MIIVYDKAKFATFYHALNAGDYIICRVRTVVETIQKSGFSEPECLIQEAKC
ncbi:hypothetical protein [Thorsellia kenyensis]|uniref:Uncharacterized protein n=1 Tax=Thorsellia kenyensis TaxID=1549888 RepID=A0ABV6C6J7_9GAMM